MIRTSIENRAGAPGGAWIASNVIPRMAPAEITAELYEALRRPNGWQSVRHFYRKLGGLDASDIAEGLLATFQKRSFTAQEVGCAILWCMNIPFSRDLHSSLTEFIVN